MAEHSPPTSDRLRHDIDSGRTGDKVDFPDPAAAPLGTDDEAAGAAPSGARREMAAREEKAAQPPRPARAGAGPLVAVAAVFVAVAAALIWILSR